MSNSNQPDPPSSHRHWHDLWACWIGIVPFLGPGAEPPGCSWTHEKDPEAMELAYRTVEVPHAKEIEAYIDTMGAGGSISISPEAEYFLGLRWNVILDFLQSLGTLVGGWHQSIIPPASLPETRIAVWLLRDWWNHHGVKRLVDMEIVARQRWPDLHPVSQKK